jgi:hypothetical protein
MKTTIYKSKSGRELFQPVIETEEEMYAFFDSNEGFCLGCGNTQMGVEPDARKYPCESCEKNLVYGFQELLIMRILQFEGE